MADKLKQITLDTDPDVAVPADTDAPKKRWKPTRKHVLYALVPIGILLVFLLVVGLMLLPLRRVIPKGQVLAQHGQAAATALKNQDLAGTKTSLADTRTALDEVSSEYDKVKPLKAVPILGRYIADGEHVLNASYAGLDAADTAIEALEPNADLLGFTGESTFVSGTADERLQTAVRTMDSLTPKIQEMAESIAVLRTEINEIDPNRYPKKIGDRQVREQIVSMQALIDNAANLFVNAQPLLENLPKLLGEPDDIRYLVLFQNNGELRATGGFITAYGQFRFAGGEAILEQADDIYNLDAALTKSFPATREISTFHKGVYNLHIRDSNLSPDFKVSMGTFEELYDAVSGREEIDGIWAVDTHVLVEALRILGPVTIAGRTFSAEIDERCDCPRAIYELEDYSTRPVGYIREARKDIIGILLQTLLKQALGVSPSQYWGQLFQMLLDEINQKHVLAYFHDEEAQKAAESFNMAGRIMTAEETAAVLSYEEGNGWDYLHINNSNMAGAKANMFVTDTVEKDTTVESDGSLTTTLMIEYDNPHPGSDCGLESGGLCLNAPLRNWVRIYVPQGSTLVESKGSISPQDEKAKPMDTYDELGKTVFEGFLIVNPLGKARLEVTYKTPMNLQEDGKYRLLLQKQAGTSEQEFTLKLNGKTRDKFEVISDTELEF